MNELPFSLKREPEQWADLYQLIKLANITAESEEIMNSNFKQTAKRFISGLIATATAITMLPHIPAFAETGTTTYSYDGYDVEYSVLNEWDNGQTVEVKVTNTGDDSILNWAFKYDARARSTTFGTLLFMIIKERTTLSRIAAGTTRLLPVRLSTLGIRSLMTNLKRRMILNCVQTVLMCQPATKPYSILLSNGTQESKQNLLSPTLRTNRLKRGHIHLTVTLR